MRYTIRAHQFAKRTFRAPFLPRFWPVLRTICFISMDRIRFSNRREPAGRLTIVWPSGRSASEMINEEPVAQAILIDCLLSGA
jgi:hypothetical protein